ncbi:MAG: hypothetical protein NXI10_03100 [bacterium]|nr:hypothetical protein [bacterium]
MKLHKVILVLCLLLTFSSNAQNSNPCDLLYSDSVFCKYIVRDKIQNFKDTFNTNGAFHVSFDKGYIQQLNDSLKDTTHVRIYFMLPTAELQIPGAVLIPNRRSQCDEDLTGTVIVAKGGGYASGIGPLSDSIIQGIQNWNDYSEVLNDSLKLSQVYAYNFSWLHLMEACHYGDDNLAVAYGLSTLDEDGNYNCVHMYLTEGTGISGDRLFLDFSKPCPQLCGGDIGKGKSSGKDITKDKGGKGRSNK